MLNIHSQEIKKVAIVGPECTGKSELSEYLSQYFNTCWVAEYARTYIDNLSTPYVEKDLVKIAHGQISLEDEGMKKANKVLICDTTLLVIKIWSNFKFERCDEEILKMIKERTYDLHLLTYIDIPWEADHQREHPEKREELWTIYKEELEQQNTPYVEIKGAREARRAIAVNSIKQLLNK